MVVVDEGCQRGAPSALHGCAGRPAAHKVTEQARVLVLEPWEHVRTECCRVLGRRLVIRTRSSLRRSRFRQQVSASVRRKGGKSHGR